MPGTSLRALELDAVTLDEALADLKAAYRIAGRSPQTVLIFDIHIGHLITYLSGVGITTLDAVRTRDLTAFLDHERERGLAPASLSVVLRTMRRFFQVAIEQGDLTDNPAKAVMAPSVVVEPVKFLSDEQVALLLSKIGRSTLEDVRDAALLRVLASGLRRGELIGLRVTDVDLDQRTLTIRPQTSKTRTGRTVGISTDAAKHLRSYLRVRAAFLARNRRQDDGTLWIAAKGSLSANGALQALRRRLAAAGLEQVSLHSFRHRFAAKAVADGMSMGYLCAAGGWSKNSTLPSQRYGMYGVEERALKAMQEHLDR